MREVAIVQAVVRSIISITYTPDHLTAKFTLILSDHYAIHIIFDSVSLIIIRKKQEMIRYQLVMTNVVVSDLEFDWTVRQPACSITQSRMSAEVEQIDLDRSAYEISRQEL